MKRLAVFLGSALLLSGCASVPFEPVELSPVEGLNPETVRLNFEARLASSFDVTDAGVFETRGHKADLLGYTRGNEKENTFAAAGFTPVGMKVFELKASGDKLESSLSLPAEVQKRLDPDKTARAIAEDIRRIYFSRVPDEEAAAEKKKDSIVFRQASGAGTLEFIFGGAETALIEKKYRENGKTLWRVRYFSYQEKSGRIYPDKIFYENLEMKYKLTLRLKEITA